MEEFVDREESNTEVRIIVQENHGVIRQEGGIALQEEVTVVNEIPEMILVNEVSVETGN